MQRTMHGDCFDKRIPKFWPKKIQKLVKKLVRSSLNFSLDAKFLWPPPPKWNHPKTNLGGPSKNPKWTPPNQAKFVFWNFCWPTGTLTIIIFRFAKNRKLLLGAYAQPPPSCRQFMVGYVLEANLGWRSGVIKIVPTKLDLHHAELCWHKTLPARPRNSDTP